MTSTVKQKSATYIEWTVKTCTNIFSLPVLSSKIDSKCFVFQNRKCNLEFYTDTSSYGDARLFLKRHGTQIPELDVVVFVSWINNSVRCSSGPERRRIKSGYEEIWRHEAGKLLGASLNFDIIIHAKLLKSKFLFKPGNKLTPIGNLKNPKNLFFFFQKNITDRNLKLCTYLFYALQTK